MYYYMAQFARDELHGALVLLTAKPVLAEQVDFTTAIELLGNRSCLANIVLISRHCVSVPCY